MKIRPDAERAPLTASPRTPSCAAPATTKTPNPARDLLPVSPASERVTPKFGLGKTLTCGSIPPMNAFAQIRESVVSLSKPERAELAALLLGSLEDTHYWVDDEEVAQRSAELDSGAVEGISREEFQKLCGR